LKKKRLSRQTLPGQSKSKTGGSPKVKKGVGRQQSLNMDKRKRLFGENKPSVQKKNKRNRRKIRYRKEKPLSGTYEESTSHWERVQKGMGKRGTAGIAIGGRAAVTSQGHPVGGDDPEKQGKKEKDIANCGGQND